MKIGHIAAININIMFPVPDNAFERIHIKKETDVFYKNLLNKELRFIKANEKIIKKNAEMLYHRALKHPESKLAKRSLDFKKLEVMCQSYGV